MAHAKCSYAKKGPSLAYRVDDGVYWEGELEVAADVLAT
jgi:hypothetical protein